MELLAAAWGDFPDSAPCSAQVKFYRHECAMSAGRTRSVPLQDVKVTSQEVLVNWNKGDPRILTRPEAEELATRQAVELDVVLAGKFSFTWKNGKCGKCGLTVMSREGVFRDARPREGLTQDDLASFAGTLQVKVSQREIAD